MACNFKVTFSITFEEVEMDRWDAEKKAEEEFRELLKKMDVTDFDINVVNDL